MILRLPSLALLASLAVACGAEPEAAPGENASGENRIAAEWVPPPVEPPITSDTSEAGLEAVIVHAIREPMGPDHLARYTLAHEDLDGDGVDEALVHVVSQGWCGVTGGCALLVYTPRSDGWHLVSRTPVTRLPVRMLEGRTNGWRDLSAEVKIDLQRHQARLRFHGDARQYRMEGDGYRVEWDDLVDPSAGRLLIGRDAVEREVPPPEPGS